MSTPNASGWKPGTPVTGHNAMSGPDTATGNRALMLEEPLLFEIGHVETTGVDLPEPQGDANRQMQIRNRAHRMNTCNTTLRKESTVVEGLGKNSSNCKKTVQSACAECD